MNSYNNGLCTDRLLIGNDDHLTNKLDSLAQTSSQLTSETSTVPSSSSSAAIKQQTSFQFSIIALFTCFGSLVLAFIFKDYFISILIYLDTKSDDNYFLLNFILFLSFIFVSLPFFWGHALCCLVCSYLYTPLLYGLLLCVIYTTCGMIFSYFVCRYLIIRCSAYNNTTIKLRNRYLDVIITIIEGDGGFKLIMLSRLVPIPFGLTNSIFSLTNVPFGRYMISSIIGLLPTQFLICYMGTTLKSMSDVIAYSNEAAHKAYFILFVQLLFAIVLMYYMLKLAKIELNRQINSIQSINMPSNVSLSHMNLIKTNDLVP